MIFFSKLNAKNLCYSIKIFLIIRLSAVFLLQWFLTSNLDFARNSLELVIPRGQALAPWRHFCVKIGKLEVPYVHEFATDSHETSHAY